MTSPAGNSIESRAEVRMRTVKEQMNVLFDELAAEWRESPIAGVARFALGESGKMFRPGIMLASAEAVGGDPDALTAVAAGIEYGHVASLMHDDIVDGDRTRRHQASVWVQFSPPEAIVGGDLFLFAAFRLLARERRVPPERVLAAFEAVTSAGIDACFGTSMESAQVGDLSVELPAYLRMAAGKTGAVLRGCSEGGAVLGGGSPEQVAAARRYGVHLGVAFQIIDDVLPYETDEATFGKPLHSDLLNRRPTAPVLLAVQAADPDDRAEILAMFAAPSSGDDALEETMERLRGHLRRTRALDRARELAVEYADRARADLDDLLDNDGTAALHALVAMCLSRMS